MDFFIATYENSEKWNCTSAKIKEMESYLEVDNHPWPEYIYRMNQFTEDKKSSPKKFQWKINGIALHCLTWLKKHPATVSDEMRELLESHPQKMAWCLKQFKVKETLSGDEIVVRDDLVQDQMQTKKISMPSLEAKMMTSTVKIADMLETLAQSITPQQLKGMDIEDKLKHIERLYPMLVGIGKMKPTGNAFTQININGSTDEMEKQMLNFVSQKS
jgi:mannose/fructose/N-acetylgalactosamine-specific phosphotransferase system component IIB